MPLTRSHLESELTSLREDILRMSVRVCENLSKARMALIERDHDLAREAKRSDSAVDEMRAAIEDRAAMLIATQQPVAKDLRTLVSVFRVVDNLERIGDHAVHLAKTASMLADNPWTVPVDRLATMAETGRSMLERATDAFISIDPAASIKIAAMDETINANHKAFVGEVLERAKDDPETIKNAWKLMRTSGYLERLGDHITNICECVIYVAEGKHVELNE